MVVTERLRASSVLFEKVELGKITLQSPPTDEQFDRLRRDLKADGFELLGDRKSSLVADVKASYLGMDATNFSKLLGTVRI